jgi:hypothetical protein
VKKYSDDERKEIFNSFWEQSMMRLEKIANVEEVKEKKLAYIQNYFTYLIEQNGKRANEFGLLDVRSNLPTLK